jgi:hypothetical protein
LWKPRLIAELKQMQPPHIAVYITKEAQYAACIKIRSCELNEQITRTHPTARLSGLNGQMVGDSYKEMSGVG